MFEVQAQDLGRNFDGAHLKDVFSTLQSLYHVSFLVEVLSLKQIADFFVLFFLPFVEIQSLFGEVTEQSDDKVVDLYSFHHFLQRIPHRLCSTLPQMLTWLPTCQGKVSE